MEVLLKSLTLGYSTCPNDTYIMAALAEHRTPWPIPFHIRLADVETLNQWALERRLDVTKLSFMALGHVRNDYGLLYSGAALGWGCGPLLVARSGMGLARLDSGIVAAPGALTTARLLLSLFHGRSPHVKQMIFSEVMPAVSRGEADYGLVIHEGRFTYAAYGLEALLDLGAWWEDQTSLPIPLGCIAIRRDLGPELAKAVDATIRRSLTAAADSPGQTMQYVRAHAQEMDPDVIRQHIELYVNSFSQELSREARNAIDMLFAKAEETGLIQPSAIPLTAY